MESALFHVSGYPSANWTGEAAASSCRELERGKVLYFSSVPFDFPLEDRQFLLGQKQTGSRFHKNISYRPGQDLLKGVSTEDQEDRERLQSILRGFSAAVVRFLSDFLRPYAGKLLLDYASYRPLEEKSRDLTLHKRNDLLHVDAFPSRPTHGGRILRVFANINPSEDRVWSVGGPFQDLLPELQKRPEGLPRFPESLGSRLERLGSKLGLPLPDRSPYDHYMLHLHDWLKENAAYQRDTLKQELRFPPGSSWMVYTDGVPHSVLSGQYALEQTFIVPPSALVAPEFAPFRVLEKVTGSRAYAARG